MSKLILRSHDVRDTIERCMSGHPSENWSEYVTGWINPHYPVPAIRTTDYVNLGYVSALNNFPLDAVWRLRQAMKS